MPYCVWDAAKDARHKCKGETNLSGASLRLLTVEKQHGNAHFICLKKQDAG